MVTSTVGCALLLLIGGRLSLKRIVTNLSKIIANASRSAIYFNRRRCGTTFGQRPKVLPRVAVILLVSNTGQAENKKVVVCGKASRFSNRRPCFPTGNNAYFGILSSKRYANFNYAVYNIFVTVASAIFLAPSTK